MPEAQYVVSGFNIAGLDPIEVSKPVVGSSITLADSDISKMNVFSGTANTTVTLPSPSGTLDGYSKAGRSIGFRGAYAMGAKVTLALPGVGDTFAGTFPSGGPTTIPIVANHILVLYSDGTKWIIQQHRVPPLAGFVHARRSVDTGLAAGANVIAYNSILDGNSDGWYNTATGIYSPTLPGYYEFTMAGIMSSAVNNFSDAYVRRNGGEVAYLGGINLPAGVFGTTNGTAKVYGDGVSDSFTLSHNCNTGGTTLYGSGTVRVYMQARYLGLK